MSPLTRRILITLAASAVGLLVLALLPLTLPVADDYRALSASSELAALSVGEETEIWQEVPATGRLITAVSILLRGDRRTAHGTLRVAVMRKVGEGWKVVGKAATKAPIRRETLHRFKFKRPVKVVPGEVLSLRLTANGEARGLAWMFDPSASQQSLALRVNALEQAGAGRFVVHYKRVTGTVAGLSPLLWKRVTVFSHRFAKTLLAGGFMLAFFALVYAVLWPPKDEEDLTVER